MERLKNKIFYIVLSAVVILIIGGILYFTIFQRANFEITDFTMTSETSDYTYTTNYTHYDGKGLITTPNKNETYLVALKIKLKSGGSEESKAERCMMVIVNNGKGEFATYDSGDVGKITKPQYDFEILGYVKF